MHKALEDICDQLDRIAEGIEAWDTSDNRLSVTQSWHTPAVSPQQMAHLPRYMSAAIREADIEDITKPEDEALALVETALTGLVKEILPNISGSPSPGAIAYIGTLNYCTMILGPIHGWSTVKKGTLPSPLTRKLASIDRDLARITPHKLDLEGKIAAIIEAHEAAETLPTTLQELKDTQGEVRSASSTASELLGNLKRDVDDGRFLLSQLQDVSEEGTSIKSQIEEAYQMATTKGLAASFDARAKKLNSSVYIWVAGLAIALLVAMLVGYIRLEAMKDALAAEPFSGTRVWVQTILTILSVAAPVWFAWIATKQISQRFRLAEDYAFKASVAKAYEGYRREAVRIDPEFEKVLFASALTRLDEAPLRLVELTTHGSPAHEFADSGFVKGVLGGANAIKQRFRRPPALAQEPPASKPKIEPPKEDVAEKT